MLRKAFKNKKMDLGRKRKDSKVYSKEKKLKKLINKSDSDSDESEHELSHYLNDRVKLMKEVLKIIKPKKIKTMAPDCISKLDIEEINSMLLEELLGISNKRLKYIFNGQNLEEDSSSTDPEAEQQPIDVISLDDISDDDFVIDLDSDNEAENKRCKKHRKPKIKEEGKRKKIKKEKEDKASKTSKDKEKMDEQNLMSVLELLELQARARAIRSQLALEANKKAEEQEKQKTKDVESDNDDAIIIESPRNIEIIITSSESENENYVRNNKEKSSSGRSIESRQDNKDQTHHNSKQVKENGNNLSSEISNLPNDTSHGSIVNEVNEEIGNKKSEEENATKKKSADEKTEETIRSNTQIKYKVTNIETVIISPAKTNIVDQNTKNDEECKIKHKKNSREGTGEQKVTTTKLEKGSTSAEGLIPNSGDLYVKNAAAGESKSYETQNSVLDEGDGIIINMEQSEIDCIMFP